MKTRNHSDTGSHAEYFLTLVEQVYEHELGTSLLYLAEEAEKYTVDKSGDGVHITALFPDASFISVVLDDAGYVEKVVSH